ncbi:MAG: glycosyltransferase [Agathobacter sp.]
MKILITTDLYTVKTNGVVTSLKNLREELLSKGHEVRVLTFSEGLKSHIDNEEGVYYIKSVPIGFIYPNVRMPISYHNSLVRELVAWKPDVIHSQCEFFSYQFAKRIAKLTGAPLIHTYHTMYEDYVGYVVPSKRFGKYFVKNFSRIRLKNANVVIAPTTKVAKTLRSYGLKNEIDVVPSGVSLKQHNYKMSPEERAEKRRALGIPEDHNVVLNLGRLGTEKNLDELVQYFALVLKLHDKLTFLIVGDGPAKKSLEDLATKLGVRDHIIFTGMVAPTEVQMYYQLADLFVSASTSETQGLTYIEAAANGLPLLCRKDECLCDIIIDGENGYQYTTVDEFQKELNDIIGDSNWRENAGKRSKEIAETFDKSHFGDTMETIYQASKA